MINDSEFARVAKILGEKQTISICLPSNPTADAVAAATSMYLALLQMGKNVGLACSTELKEPFGMIAEDKIQATLISDGNNLVVSFPYTDGSVDKVTYNIEGDRFNLLVQPREGFDRLDPKQVTYSYTGGKPDAIIAIYAPTLNSLGDLYTNQKEQFTGVEIINIDRHFTNANFGSINIVDKKSSSMSELVLGLLRSLKIKIDKDIATNLYSGIIVSTNNFTAHSVNAQTFEAVAFLMNNGAVKKAMQPRQNQSPTNAFGGFQDPFAPQYMAPQQQMMPQAQFQPQPLQPQQTQFTPQFEEQVVDFQQPVQEPQPQLQPQPQQVIQSSGGRPESAENKEVKPLGNDNSKDWLKPKIFNKNKNLL